MNKIILISAFSLICISTSLYSVNRRILKYTSFEDVQVDIENLYNLMQLKQHNVFTRIPNVIELEPGELVLAKVGSNVKLYCRVLNSTYSVTMSN